MDKKVGPFWSGEESAASSCTKEQSEHALKILGECEGRIAVATAMLGYPFWRTMCQRISRVCAARARTAGRLVQPLRPAIVGRRDPYGARGLDASGTFER